MSVDLPVFSPPIIAHRGARNRAPENTMAAFVAAHADGATWIETDVKLTSDGVPILMHDETLDRTTSGHGAVADASWEDLKRLDAGSWFDPAFAQTHVPTLAELLAFARQTDMRLNLKLKPCPGRTQATVMVSLIEAAKLWPEDAPPLFLSSFDVEALVIAARLHPGWPRGLLMDAWRDDWRDLMRQTGAVSLHLQADLLTPDRLHLLRENQVPVLAYTVNDGVRALDLFNHGVRAVFTDNPRALIAAHHHYMSS